MATLRQVIEFIVTRRPGISERELAEAIYGEGAPQQKVHSECALLLRSVRIARYKRPDGIFGYHASQSLAA